MTQQQRTQHNLTQRKLTQRKLILASQSPRRRQLLLEAGHDFQVIPPSEGAECGACSGESPAEFVVRQALQKANDVAQRIEDQGGYVVIGCDTVAECDGQILGKPTTEDHARAMLHQLRGRRHRVLSGLCLVWRPEEKVLTNLDITELEMLTLDDEQIEEYLDTGLWEGKAGGFGLQDRTGWVKVVSGSPSNVVGLPMELLDRMLMENSA